MSERADRLRASLAETERCVDVALEEARRWLETWEQAVALRGRLKASLAEEERGERMAVRDEVEKAGRRAGKIMMGSGKPLPY